MNKTQKNAVLAALDNVSMTSGSDATEINLKEAMAVDYYYLARIGAIFAKIIDPNVKIYTEKATDGNKEWDSIKIDGNQFAAIMPKVTKKVQELLGD